VADSRERIQRTGDQVRVAHLISECSQVLADFPAAAGKVVTIPNRTRGPVMTVRYEPRRPNRIGSPHALTLTHQEGSNAHVGSFRATYDNLICDTA
jgi:hypothetical protein